MSKLKPALIALSLMLVAPMAVQASEITPFRRSNCRLAIGIITAITGTAAAGATMTGGRRIMSGAITTGVHMMSIAIVTIVMTTATTITDQARTGSITNTNPASRRG